MSLNLFQLKAEKAAVRRPLPKKPTRPAIKGNAGQGGLGGLQGKSVSRSANESSK